MKRLISLLIVIIFSFLSGESKVLFQSPDRSAVVAVKDSILNDYTSRGFVLYFNSDETVSVYRERRCFGRYGIFCDRARRVFLLFKL